MIKYFRLLLLPFSVLYGIVILIRNKLYDFGIFKQTQFDLPVICVGNLVVGGAGKSPVTEYLVQLLDGQKIAVLSRGYGRKTTGYVLADETATAETIGDEPMQFYRKFPHVTVAVCEDRVTGINQLCHQHDVILLDDAFQHRKLKPGFSILLFEYQKLLTSQFLLPAGNLREPFIGYQRADVLLVTKAPDLITEAQRIVCEKKINPPNAPALFFSHLVYQELVHLISLENKPCSSISSDTTVFLLTGIANPQPLLLHLKQYTSLIRHHDYPDHHQYSKNNIHELVKSYHDDPSDKKIIITTEKDAQRLLDAVFKELLLNLPIFYLPIKVAVQEKDKVTFDQKILDYVSSTTRNH